MNDCVLIRDDNEVRIITLNRPHRLNAITPALLDGLNTALGDSQRNPSIGAIVLTGAGRAFCAGDDLIEQQSMCHADEGEIRRFVNAIQDVTRNIMFGDTPVVAAVQGWAVGGAFSWPINCDLSIWAEDARAFFPELKIGLFVSGAVTYLLPLEIGAARAREMIYTSRKYDANTLHAFGLVARCVPRTELLDAAITQARQLARLPAPARTGLKQAFATPRRKDIEQALLLEANAVVDCLLDPATYERIEQESDRGRNPE